MKLGSFTVKERQIIVASQLHARSSTAEIASRVGLKPSTVRSTLQRLLEKRALFPLTYIDITRAGYTDYCCYFSLRTANKEQRAQIRTALIDSPRTTWFAELAGQYQYTVALYSKDIPGVDRFLSALSEECQVEFTRKVFTTRVRWALFGQRFLLPEAPHSGTLACSPLDDSPELSLDSTDQAILRALNDTPSMPVRKLARELGIPAATIRYRQQRLEENGIIKGYMYLVDSARCGLHHFRILIHQKNATRSFSDDLFSYCEQHPNITCFVHCIGTWDFELSVEVEDIRSFPEILAELQSDFDELIRDIAVITVVNTLKSSLFPYTEHVPGLSSCSM